MEDESINAFMDYLLHTKGLMNRSVEHYIGYYKSLDKTRELDQEYCNQFIQAHKNHSVVRGMMLNLLEFMGLDKTINMPPKKTGSKPKRVVRGIEKEDLNKLIKYFYSKNFKFGLMFELIYQGALRRIEVPTIKINSFQWVDWIRNLNAGKFVPCRLVVLGKRDKERVVLINFETAERLINHFMKKYKITDLEDLNEILKSESLLFKNLSENYIYKIIHKGSIHCIGRDVRPHELRHARATELEDLGVPIKDIKVYLGHSNLATTEIYLHSDDKKSIDKISNLITQEKKGE